MTVFQLHKEQKIPADVDEVWDFISSPKNLKRLTPDYMGFDITSKHLPEKMYPGMIICYNVRPLLRMKMTWVTEITHVVDKKFFIDQQRIGPYKIWHHQHKLSPLDDGVLMTDLITYKPPLGFIGALANSLFIRERLDEIFEYRSEMLIQIFGE